MGTSKKKNIVLVGGGGHCKVIIDAINASGEFNIYGIIDNKLSPRASVLGVKVIGSDDLLQKIFNKGITNAFIAVGSIGDCSARKAIYKNLKTIGFILPVVIHPKAVVAESVQFEEGTFVAAGAVINPDVRIGKNVIVNTSSSIDHDCEIGDFVHIAPGATLSGTVKIDSGTHIGTGANVIQQILIGKNCVIGSGCTLRQNILNNKVFLGAKRKEKR